MVETKLIISPGTQNLEIAVVAPIVVFEDGIKYFRRDGGNLYFSMPDGCDDKAFYIDPHQNKPRVFQFPVSSLLSVFQGNHSIGHAPKSDLTEDSGRMQINFRDIVAYLGTREGKHVFPIKDGDGEYQTEHCSRFSSEYLRVIADTGGNVIWKK